MKNSDLERLNVSSLSVQEMSQIEGGLIGLLIAYVFQATLVGVLAYGLYANFQRGYEQAIQE